MQIKLQIPLSKPETGEGEQAELFYEAFKSSDWRPWGYCSNSSRRDQKRLQRKTQIIGVRNTCIL